MPSRLTSYSGASLGAGWDLGRLVVALLTGWAWIARTRLGFIVPTARAGGDALPLHDTAGNPVIDWTFSPSRPPLRTLHPVADETVMLGDLGPTDRWVPAANHVSSPMVMHARSRSSARRMPWSLALAVMGSGSVWLVGQVVDPAAGPIASVAFWASVTCGVLLTVAQLMDGSRR